MPQLHFGKFGWLSHRAVMVTLAAPTNNSTGTVLDLDFSHHPPSCLSNSSNDSNS